MAVDFSNEVCSQLSESFRKQLERELAAVFTKTGDIGTGDWRLLVSRCFDTYTKDVARRVVLGVEVSSPNGFATHIVKIGEKSEVADDAKGWTECTQDRQVCSRIFAPVRNEDVKNDRMAVIYQDAYTLFGMSPADSRPVSLEQVVKWSVNDSHPDLLSVERAIAHIYTDLGKWFYPGSVADPPRARDFYRRRMKCAAEREPSVGDRWRNDQARTELRRQVLWLLTGRDKPNATSFQYLDPLELVEWCLEDEAGERLPSIRVGRSHGDLHGRNILLGVRRGEAEYPAVFDYGEMRPDNVLAWDFAKLETELKIKLVPSLLNNSEVIAWARERLRKTVPWPESPAQPNPLVERTRHIATLFALEQRLAELTELFPVQADFASLSPLPGPSLTGIRVFDRMVAILLRIRKEAAYWLEQQHANDRQAWHDDYFFAMAVYGLVNVRWNYSELEQTVALVSAGVAAAKILRATAEIRRQMSEETADSRSVPSYRVLVARLFRLWEEQKFSEGNSLAEQTVFERQSTRDGHSRLQVHPRYSHAVPLIAQGALLELEGENWREVETLLNDLRGPARLFGDHEMLARIGRIFKETGDHRWVAAAASGIDFKDSPAQQMYKHALTAYEEAYLATNDYYVGINAATLALLSGDRAKSEQLARQVASQCAAMTDIPRDEWAWVFASEGEAHLLLGFDKKASDYYRNALQELSPLQASAANSAYKQVCRLAKAGVPAELTFEAFESGYFNDGRTSVRPILTPILGHAMAKPAANSAQ